MHKKPIYSFENSGSTGIMEVPILSILAIENAAGLPNLDPSGSDPRLVIVLNKFGLTTSSTIANFIANVNNWMWFYNGGLEGRFVRITGDTMTGDLKIANGKSLDVEGTISADLNVSSKKDVTAGGAVTAVTSITSGSHIRAGTNLYSNKYFNIYDYDDGLTHGMSSYMRDGTWNINKGASEPNPIFIKIEGYKVLTELTGVMFHDYAKPTVGGIIKARRSGNTLYMTVDGSNP